MPIQILPPKQSEKSWGEILGTGLGQGLNALIQHKVSEAGRANNLKRFQGIGFTPAAAELLNYVQEVDPSKFTQVLQSLGSGAYTQSRQYQPQEYINEEMQTPGGENVSVQEEVSAAAPMGGHVGGLFDKGLSEKEKAERFKATKEYRQSILDARKSARSDLRDLGRLEELNQEGKLDTAGYVQFLHNSGLDIPALMSEDSQEFAKIQQSFLKNIKNIFGARVSNFEVEQFLKTIPSLSQTPSGRARVIANLKLMTRGSEEYYKAYEDVLRENKGVPPLDVQEQVERKIDKDKRLDRIYNQFKEDLKKPIPKGQNRIITGLQAGAGSSVKPLAGAAAGALIGSIVPGIGTGLGALGGGAAALGGKLVGLI